MEAAPRCSVQRVLALVLVLVLATSAHATPTIRTRCAATLAEHERTLQDELARALAGADAHIVLDVSLVTVTDHLVGTEVEVEAEVRAVVSDEHGAMRWSSRARATVRGALPARAQLRRDAVIEATRALAATIRKRL